MKKIIVLLLVMSFVPPAASAQGLLASADREASRVSAALMQEADQPTIMGIQRNYFGLGLGFMGGGGGWLVYMLATRGEECTTTTWQGGWETTCYIKTHPTWWYAASAGAIGAGAAFWVIGKSKASKVAALMPTIVPIRGGWSVQKAITF